MTKSWQQFFLGISSKPWRPLIHREWVPHLSLDDKRLCEKETLYLYLQLCSSFCQKNSAHLIQRKGESHLSLAMHCCARKNIISVFVVLLNFWPTRKMGDSYQKIMTRAPSVPEDTMLFEKVGFYLFCGCVYLLANKKLGQLSSSENECPICPLQCTPGWQRS